MKIGQVGCETMSNIIELHKKSSNFEERRQKRNFKKKRNRIIFTILLMMLIITISLIFVFNSKLFSLDEIEINGLNSISYNEIILVSNLDIGRNIFKISKNEVTAAIDSLPYVNTCSVKRILPNKISIDIEERQEDFVVFLESSILFVNREGYLLKIEDLLLNKEEVFLPQVIGLEIVNINLGDNIFHNNENIDLSGLISDFIEDKLFLQVSKIDVSDENNINIIFKDGLKVALGTLNDVKYKISFLNKIFNDIETKNIFVKEILFNLGENPVIITD